MWQIRQQKLETIYDRIHEVRMRFELLKQQAETDYWKAIANGALQEEQLKILEQSVSELMRNLPSLPSVTLAGSR